MNDIDHGDDDGGGSDLDIDPDESVLGPEGCCLPGECCMPGPHYESECHTAEMLMALEEEQNKTMKQTHINRALLILSTAACLPLLLPVLIVAGGLAGLLCGTEAFRNAWEDGNKTIFRW